MAFPPQNALPLSDLKDRKRGLPFSHLTSPSVTDSAKAGVLTVTTSSPLRTQKQKKSFQNRTPHRSDPIIESKKSYCRQQMS